MKKLVIKKLVVKVGTGNLLNKKGYISQTKVKDLCRQIAQLAKKGIQVVIVSSGAIKAGKDRMASLGKNPNLAKKEWAGIGARHLLNLWGKGFSLYKNEVAQVWLTYANWKHKNEYQSIKASILSYMQSGIIIPIVNENDVVSDREIKSMDKGISENDRLARMVAKMIKADAVLFLTDIGGIFDKDPKDMSARKYKTVSKGVLKMIPKTDSKSAHGTGGVDTKLREAFKCFKKGMKVAIAGMEKDVLLKFSSGQCVGTLIGEKTVL